MLLQRVSRAYQFLQKKQVLGKIRNMATGFTENIVTLPTRLTLRCRGCERVATIRKVLPKVKNADGFTLPPKFRCKVCGSTDVVVKQRGATWNYRPTLQDRRKRG